MKPTIALSNPNSQCATLFWEHDPGYHVGYRFMEFSPEITDTPLAGLDEQPRFPQADAPSSTADVLPDWAFDSATWGKFWTARYDEQNPADARQLRFRSQVDGIATARGLERGGAQERTFVFQAVDHGLHMWMTMKTKVSVTGSLAVQQCLRFSGATAKEWRQPIAGIPFLSEFDVQARVNPHETLTYARRDGQWIKFPIPHTCYHTAPGRSLAGARSSGVVDHGLIVRESLDRRYASGMYWERTAYISNRHHADCVHAALDFGPLKEGESRTVQGRFYFVRGSRDDLLALFDRDMAVGNN
jgi:hypothetical protein